MADGRVVPRLSWSGHAGRRLFYLIVEDSDGGEESLPLWLLQTDSRDDERAREAARNINTTLDDWRLRCLSP